MSRAAEFRSAILDAARPVPDGLTDRMGRPAGRRFAVYRNDVAVSLTEALEAGFPAVRALLGQSNFHAVAGLYLRREPPRSPVLPVYGEGFPAFLADHPPLSHLGYLADVARLELALRQSYNAADSAPVPATDVTGLDEAALYRTGLVLAPSVRLVRSDWPVVDLWKLATGATSEKPRPLAQDALILRPAFDPAPHALPSGGADFIASLARGTALGTAIEDAGDTDTAPVLTLLLTHAGLAGLNPQEARQ